MSNSQSPNSEEIEEKHPRRRDFKPRSIHQELVKRYHCLVGWTALMIKAGLVVHQSIYLSDAFFNMSMENVAQRYWETFNTTRKCTPNRCLFYHLCGNVLKGAQWLIFHHEHFWWADMSKIFYRIYHWEVWKLRSRPMAAEASQACTAFRQRIQNWERTPDSTVRKEPSSV